jgi:hypothetical protein
MTQLLEGNAPFIGRSHRTMLIFRRDPRRFVRAKEIELRHQRNPDVETYIVCTGAGAPYAACLFIPQSDSMSASPDGRLLTPEAAYVAIETLLTTGYTPGTKGKFLELWAHPEIRRPGWRHIVCANGPK